jgi:hypothetical protein
MQTCTIYQTCNARAAAGIFRRNPDDRLLICWVEYDPPATGDESPTEAVYESVRVHISPEASDYYAALLTLADNVLAPYADDDCVIDLLDDIEDAMRDAIAEEYEDEE